MYIIIITSLLKARTDKRSSLHEVRISTVRCFLCYNSLLDLLRNLIYYIKRSLKYILYNTVARDVPGGKRILIIKINARHNALSKAIKTRFKIESIYYVTFRLNSRHLQTNG